MKKKEQSDGIKEETGKEVMGEVYSGIFGCLSATATDSRIKSHYKCM